MNNKYKYSIGSINLTAKDQSTINFQGTSNNVIKDDDTDNLQNTYTSSDILHINKENDSSNNENFITDNMVPQNEMIISNGSYFKMNRRKINIAANTNIHNNDSDGITNKGTTISIVTGHNNINVDFKNDTKDTGSNINNNIDELLIDDMIPQNEMFISSDLHFKTTRRKISIATSRNNDSDGTLNKGITINIVSGDNNVNVGFSATNNKTQHDFTSVVLKEILIVCVSLVSLTLLLLLISVNLLTISQLSIMQNLYHSVQIGSTSGDCLLYTVLLSLFCLVHFNS